MRPLTKLLSALLVSAPLMLPAAAYDDVPFSQAELDQMLAPIALYPDTVLSHVLIASTYPLEVVQAARWSRANPGLEGDAAAAAVEDMDWDPSVKALVAFPELLARMDEDLEWTRQLGDAFLTQEAQVMDSVQDLRARADDAGHLESAEHVRVIREHETIYIEPAVRHVVYLPYYDTRVIYGHWWWPAYPPVYWYPSHYVRYYSSHVWFHWGFGVHVTPWFYHCAFNWPQRRVVVVHHHRHHPSSSRTRFSSSREVAHHRDARPWQHNTAHRRGVAYRNESLAREYRQPRRQTARPAAVHSGTPASHPTQHTRPAPVRIDTNRGRSRGTDRQAAATHNPRAAEVRRDVIVRSQPRSVSPAPVVSRIQAAPVQPPAHGHQRVAPVARQPSTEGSARDSRQERAATPLRVPAARSADRRSQGAAATRGGGRGDSRAAGARGGEQRGSRQRR